MTVHEINVLNKKAETRKDGVYSFNGKYWAVKSNKFVAYVDKGLLLQRIGAFNYVVTNFGCIEKWEKKEKLMEWLKQQK